MKIVYSWLKDLIDIDVPAEDLAEALTSSGLEVASVENRRTPEGIVVCRVIETVKHPDADRLSVCKVDAGGSGQLTIVCGAPNVRAGIHVPLATIGTVLSPELKIKKTKIRGVESYGMLCSEKELGISDDHSGLMILPESTVPGTPFSDYYPDDAVIEIELTPDRGYCLSVLGVAREVAARFGLPLKPSAMRPEENPGDPVEAAISVNIEAPDRCPRYAGRLVRNVTIAPSPQWLQYRLSLAGIRPINNIVDVTNYMMLHFGQPMHAFDYRKLGQSRIVVRNAGDAGSFTTLDSNERRLQPEDLLIHDGLRPVALAGIMGGAGSEITSETRDVFLECAYFEPVGIRKTSKRLGCTTDSSYRFERGVDPDQGLIDALDTAAELLSRFAGGKVAFGRIDEYPRKLERRIIDLHTSRTGRVLGASFTAGQIAGFLQSLQIGCEITPEDIIRCTVPLYRHDLSTQEDLIEEVGRMYGYDNIVPAESVRLSLMQNLPRVERVTDTLRHALAFSGLHEAVTNSMTSGRKCRLLTPGKKPVEILNPLTPDMAFMRTTLLGSLLEITAYNINRKNVDNRFFEAGKVFETGADGNAEERNVVAILLEGNYWPATWNNPAQPVSFHLLKGVLEALCTHLGLDSSAFTLPSPEAPAPEYFGREVAEVSLGNLMSGHAGMISSSITSAFDIKTPVCYAELDCTGLFACKAAPRAYKPLPRFPALERDFSFVMDDTTGSSSISETISSVSRLIEEIYPFDLYRGEKLGAGKKSITFNVKFRSAEKTLTDEDVAPVCDRIVEIAAERFGAVLRT